jgi:hypothetical protein
MLTDEPTSQDQPMKERDPATIPISLETEYTRSLAEALIEVNGKKWGKRFLRKWGDRLAHKDTFAIPIRHIAGAERAAQVHHDALSLFQGHLPSYLALLGI